MGHGLAIHFTVKGQSTTLADRDVDIAALRRSLDEGHTS